MKNSMLFLKRWSSSLVMAVWVCSLGCGSGVLLRQEGEGGVVQYLYQEHDGHLLSPNRSEALSQITRFCVGPYTMIQEGPTRGRRRVVEGIASSDVITENWWGIRFTCSAKPEE